MTPNHRRHPECSRGLRSVSLIASLWMAGCEKTPAPTTSPPAVEPPAVERPAVERAVAVPKRFAEMDDTERREHMATVVVPRMARLFEAADASRWAGLSCQTCHGYSVPGAPMVRPQNTLPRLTLSGDGLQKLKAKHPEVTTFMAEVVVPAMAEAMGETPFDPATGEGFGCAGCHEVD